MAKANVVAAAKPATHNAVTATGVTFAGNVTSPANVNSPVIYGLGKLPRNGLNQGTKHGNGGTAGTYVLVCKALAAAPAGLSIAAIQAVCKANNDPGFARYAVRNQWLQPVKAS
jgi:hypothetical protein